MELTILSQGPGTQPAGTAYAWIHAWDLFLYFNVVMVGFHL